MSVTRQGSGSAQAASVPGVQVPGAWSAGGRGRRPAASLIVRMAVNVQQLQPGGLQPARGQGGEPAHEVVAEARVLVALAAQALPVHLDGTDPLDGAPVEL